MQLFSVNCFYDILIAFCRKRALGGRAGGISDEKDGSAYTDVAIRAFSMQNSNLKVSSKTSRPRKQSVTCLQNWWLGARNLEILRLITRLIDRLRKYFERVTQNFGGLPCYQLFSRVLITNHNRRLLVFSPWQDIKVESVRTQVVSGMNYFMKVSATEDGEPRTCEVNVWSQPWLGDAGFKVTKFACKEWVMDEIRTRNTTASQLHLPFHLNCRRPMNRAVCASSSLSLELLKKC